MNKRKNDGKKRIRGKKAILKLTVILVFMLMISSSIFFSGGTLPGFFKVFVIEIGVILVAAAGLAAYVLMHTDEASGYIASAAEERSRIAAEHANEAEKRLRKLEARNFNWIIDENKTKSSLRQASSWESSSRQMSGASARGASTLLKEEPKRKYFPYRSPFERINPPRETEETAEKLKTQESGGDAEANKPSGALEEPDGRERQSISDIPVEDEMPGESSGQGLAEKDSAERDTAGQGITGKDSAERDPVKSEIAERDTAGKDAGRKDTAEEESEQSDKNVENGKYIEEYFTAEAEREDIAAGIDDEADETDWDSLDEDNQEGSFTADDEEDGAGNAADYAFPSVELLSRSESSENTEAHLPLAEKNAVKLIDTLQNFGVGASVVNISIGPAVTRYEVQPNTGVKVSKIVSLADDIALNLAATGVRIEAPIPGKAAIGIEVPNREITPVLLRDVIESEEFRSFPSKLAFAVGKDIAGKTVVADIAKMPHLLIAGATGSGKSVCINTLIASILYKAKPSEVKLLMVDPKVVELGIYNGIPHLLIPVVTDPRKAAGALNWAVVEMNARYKLFADNNVRDIKGYNAMVRQKGGAEPLPQIVIIIDELADLMMAAPGEVEDSICRLAQMARAAGMHLVIATQRPSVDVITGVIKANIPSRISFAVTSQIDSRTILDMAGAEKLLGRGDMLFSPIGKLKPLRVQGAFISDREVEDIVAHVKASMASEYDHEVLEKIEKHGETGNVDVSEDDELLPQAIEMVLDMGQASASLVQRKFKVGYSRAARILDQMEAWGVVGPPEGSKPRQILITRQQWDELNA